MLKSFASASLCVLAAVSFTGCATPPKEEPPKQAARPAPVRTVRVASSTNTNTSTTIVKSKKRPAPTPWATEVVSSYDDNSR